MSLEKTFCSSTLIHAKINNAGIFEYCRWKTKNKGDIADQKDSIQNISPLEYFQNSMSDLRDTFLQGSFPTNCSDCATMEQYGKVSGRQRQLLKVGFQTEYFEKSLASSTLRSAFDYSMENKGHTTRMVSDWQIDLGNYCNSACVFCVPESSSRLAQEFYKLKMIDQVPAASWCDNPELLDKFITDLVQTSNLQYLHFIGGETLITPGFVKILQAVVDAGLHTTTTIGFTTNLTVWSESTVELLTKFQQVNLGMSIESLTSVNDYVRWPSNIESVKTVLNRWVELGKKQNWLMQLRVTPSCLSVHEISTVYDYAWHNQLSVESCNFFDEPKFLRIGVFPIEYRKFAIDQLSKWIADHNIQSQAQIINTRDPNVSQQQICQDAVSYLNYLKSAPDESDKLPNLVVYLKQLESNRGNSILTYLPQYEDLFRSAGY